MVLRADAPARLAMDALSTWDRRKKRLIHKTSGMPKEPWMQYGLIDLEALVRAPHVDPYGRFEFSPDGTPKTVR